MTQGDVAEAESRQQAVARIQDTVRWLLTTVAAVATALLVGVNLSDLSEADGGVQIVALALTLICLAFVALTLWSAGRVLVAKPMSLGELLSVNGSRAFRRELEELNDLTVGDVNLTRETLGQWRERRIRSAQEMQSVRRKWRGAGSPESGTEYVLLKLLEDDLSSYDAALAAAETMADTEP